MDIKQISIIATFIIAFLGYIITYLNNLQLARRKDELDLINKQINEFYGPLFIASEAGLIAFKSLKEKLGGENIFHDRNCPKIR